MDDVFDENASEDILMEREHSRVKDKLLNLGIKEGILEKKFVQDEDVVSEKFIEGFNKNIEIKRLLGRLTMIEYITGKFLPQEKEKEESKSKVLKTFNDIVDRIGKEDLKKTETDIESLIQDIQKLMSEP